MNLQSLSGAEHCYGETVRAVRELEKYRDSCLVITIGYACPMELRHLRYFIAVAEEENVSRAALSLRVSQPGISRQIHDLEDEIGFLLFARSGKSVRLTVAGKIFFGEARDILQRTTDAVERARAGLASQAEINIGYIPSGTVEILPRELDMKEVARYETCVAVGATHPLAKSKLVSLDQMASEPVAVYIRKDYPGYHKHLEKLFGAIGRKPRIGSEHDSGSSLIAAVAAGREFALLPSCVSGTAGPRLKLLKLRPALPPWCIVALWRKDAETESVKAFVAAALAKPTKNGRPPAS